MSSLALLYQELFRVCANGCIPNLKFLSALLNLHAKMTPDGHQLKLFHHTEDPLTWGPSAGGKVRMVAAKFRGLALSQDKYECCMTKAWGGHMKIDWAI